ncbi:Retrovirus-related Pol polyprotein from transposon TNT 1-94 [Bienertia sinuspersici]
MSTKIDVTSALYLHPSEGTNTLSVEKLEGSGNFRSWKRSMEIALASKRKLGFVTGEEKKDNLDAVKSEAWETCNNMVISWILTNVSESIKKSVMFVGSAQEIWKQLENRFSIANGSRKYQLCKAMYEMKQLNKKISDYYTELKCLWEEFEALKDYPPISRLNTEMSAYVNAVKKEEEEQKLFQFLNGLNDQFSTLRSHILMMSPLPMVDVACGMLQQEESQQQIFNQPKEEAEGFAMLGRRTELTCSNCNKRGHSVEKCWACKVCGKSGHTSENCWHIKGFPPKKSRGDNDLKDRPKLNYGRKQQQGKEQIRDDIRMNKGKWKMHANVCNKNESNEISAQQLEQLLKFLPLPSKSNEDEIADDGEVNYVEVAECNMAHSQVKEWIIDSGATHHMTGCLKHLENVKKATNQANIHLPNGDKTAVTYSGSITLENGVVLKNVMYAPGFTHNLISACKLTQEQDCKVVFHPKFCIIQKNSNDEVIGVGKSIKGIYYMINQTMSEILGNLRKDAERRIRKEGLVANTEIEVPENVPKPIRKDYSLSVWHRRLGHAPPERIKKITGLKDALKDDYQECLVCPAAKFTRKSFDQSYSKAKQAFELVHLDTWGPYKVESRQGYKYFLTLVDDCTRTTWVHMMKTKDEAFKMIEQFINMAGTQFGKQVKRIRSDNAWEFEDKKCKPMFERLGIIHETSCVDTPQQNGRVERKHRNLLEMARALRIQSGLPLKYWSDCIEAAAHISNRLPTVILKGKSPYEVLFNSEPNYALFKVFGCLVIALNPDKGTDKFKARGIPCVFLGYPQTKRGYKLLNLITNKVFVSRHVKFYEHVCPYVEFNKSSYKSTPLSVNQFIDDANDDVVEDDNVNDRRNDEEDHDDHLEGEISGPPVNSESEPTRHSTRIHKPPTWHKDYFTGLAHNIQQVPKIQDHTYTQISDQFACFMSQTITHTEPKNIQSAINCSEWVESMNEELEALESNNTWEITDLPPNKKPIGCKWLYRIKYNPDGSVERHKSRLVVLGNRQQYGIDYDETFAPVAKLATVRSFLGVAAIKGWSIHQMDVKNAFLHGDFMETVYMKLPPGYLGIGYLGMGHRMKVGDKLNQSNQSNKVCKLNKSLYGLKQAPRQWFAKLKEVLIEYSFKQSKSDYSLFTKREGNTFTAILVYVYDLLIASNDENAINDVKSFLSNQFHMKDLGVLRYFLGIEVDRTNDGIFLSQRKYIKDLLKEYQMEGCKAVKLPVDTHSKLTAETGDPLPNPSIYQKLIGKLIYLTLTRPDIAYSIHILSQFMHSPTTTHLQAAKRIFRYLSGTCDQGILLASSSAVKLTAYCDSDWAGCPVTRRSTSGFCIMLGHSPLSWKSKRQSVVARSSAEAEYRSMAYTVCEIIWLKQLLHDLGLGHLNSVPLFCDNQAAIAISANPVYHEKTKHIAIDCHFIREKVQDGTIIPSYIPTSKQLADVFTKQLTVDKHQNLLHKLGVTSSA